MTLLAALLTTMTAFAAVGDVVDSGTCGTNLTWTLTDNGGTVTVSNVEYSTLTLTITGTGAMYDYTSATRPWGIANGIRERITTLNLPEGITHIGDYAFYFTNYSGPLVIPSTVKTIGASGFYGFNFATEEYVDMAEAGILDPTQVTRSALQNAASVAAMVLTTESLVTDIKEPAPAAPAMPAGGMDY